MTEELMVTARANELIDPSLHIWTWEVAMYLFLGGVTAGIIIFSAVVAVYLGSSFGYGRIFRITDNCARACGSESCCS